MSDSSSTPLPPNPDPVLNVEITQELIDQHGILPEEYQQILDILGSQILPNLEFFRSCGLSIVLTKIPGNYLGCFPLKRRIKIRSDRFW